MNLINKIRIKNIQKVKCKKKNNDLFLTNLSAKNGKIFILKRFKTSLHANITFDSTTEYGKSCLIKVLNNKFKTIHTISPNSDFYFTCTKTFYIAILVPPNSSSKITKLDVNYLRNYDFTNRFSNNLLMLTPGYPSNINPYHFAFVHSRARYYHSNNQKIDVVASNKYITFDYYFRTFENINICELSLNETRNLLLVKKYNKILIHFVEIEYLRLIEAINDCDTQIFLFTHGVDLIDQTVVRRTYFDKPPFPVKKVDDLFEIREKLINEFNNKNNVYFIFVSNWQKSKVEEQYKLKFNNSIIIPNFIDERSFLFEGDIDPDLRKKIIAIKPQNNYSLYSVDIIVRTILELKRRKCFDDLEFSLYGTGTEHHWLIRPLLNLENVHIYDKYLLHDEMNEALKKHGILLNPSRYDTMGVSPCEAAMCGKTVIASNGTGLSEYIHPDVVGTFCETENYVQYADKIEELYNDAEKYISTCIKTRDSVYNTCSSKFSILKEINLINSFNSNPNINIPTISENPLLTICVAAYNVEKYIIQLLSHIILCRNAELIEILVINDGSTDRTSELVQSFIKKYYRGIGLPNINLINKQNGGHGSVINVGVKLSKGKYFRVLDGDDYLVTSELDKLIDFMKKSDSDVIITDLLEDNSYYCDYRVQKNYSLMPGIKYNLDDTSFEYFGFTGYYQYGLKLATAHAKTDLLRKTNYILDEHCFYDDNEFDQMMMYACETITYMPFAIYSYYISRSGQSTSTISYKKNIKQEELVCLRLIKEFKEREAGLGKRDNLYHCLILPFCKQHYVHCLLFKSSKHFKTFNKEIKKYPKIYRDVTINSKSIGFFRKFPILIFFNKPIKKIYKLFNRWF